jgi:hypothetical protein
LNPENAATRKTQAKTIKAIPQSLRIYSCEEEELLLLEEVVGAELD